MLLIRPSQMSDLDDLMEISQAVGDGMTSMPACENAWREKLEASARAFSDAGKDDAVGTWFMVLEDNDTGKVVGTTAIYTGIGLTKPFYSYKISTLVSSSHDLDTTRQARVLSMVNDYTGATEIGSLFLLPEYRRPGMGQFLSRARYMTLADFPERFGDTVMAELRGWLDDSGRSPLWDNLGSKFFGIEFQDAVNTTALKGTQFISDLMPKYPIYIDLLPQAAREVIGKPHNSSAPALNMLKKEGFQWAGYVDLFDGGPTVQAPASEIHTVRDSSVDTCVVTDEIAEDAALFMVSNGQLENYRVALVPAELNAEGQLMISQQTADALQIDNAGQSRFIEFRRPQANQASVAA